MTDQIPASQTSNPSLRVITLDGPVMLGDRTLIEAGQEVTIRKPGSGELRGLSLASLNQLDVLSLEILLPRITSPQILKGASMDVADLMQFGGEVMDFLLPSAAKAAIRSAFPTE
ncbi:phage tail assembly protein [Sphingomonas sp. SORGH_AS_0438]|uniref:phage tail assembly protein n=1 Tax=Sphingomonas sp. SORGH_AS_0438 TaxID=3041756 RepID=UPI00285A47D3|nr:phage tail assembly protein [Sphingomonas sp. SORGH_AS_0438]MDR6128057.1 hypothetical protein [Sphingomonas sp. SORGH_AS_0438]